MSQNPLPPLDPSAGPGYTPVEPAGGTKVSPLRQLQDQVEAAYVQGRIDADTNNQIVRLLGELAPLLQAAGLAAL
jgi:hypothetical protein